MAEKLIDLWEIETFDEDMKSFLNDAESVIRAYHEEEIRIQNFVAQLTAWRAPPTNQHAAPRLTLRKQLGEILKDRTVRAFHYTRLADDEVAIIRERGMEPSTLGSLRRRVDARVDGGDLSQFEADVIFSNSPLHINAFGERTGKIWSVSGPLPIADEGVIRLLSVWGGEASYWCLQDYPNILNRLQEIGRSRIIELAVTIADANNGYAAFAVTDGILAALANRLGFPRIVQFNDLFVTEWIDLRRVLAVHTEGDEKYEQIGHERK